MSWRSGILAALLAWLWLAGPAAAQIQRHTDGRGVIHIGNVPPRLSEASLPAALPEALNEAPEPMAPPAPPKQHPPQKAASRDPGAEAIQKVCQVLTQGDNPMQSHEFDDIIAAAALAAAEREADESPAEAEPTPLKQVAHDPGPRLAPNLKTAALAAPGGIRRYRDAGGVLHISNTAPGETPEPAVQMAAAPNAPRPAVEPADLEPRLGIRPAAWDPDERRLTSLPATPAPARKAAASGPNPIRQFRDHQGVLHISNVDPEPGPAAPAPVLTARSRSSREAAPPPAATLAMGGWVLQPVAWNGEGGVKPLKRAKAPPNPHMDLTTEGGIRRHRDKNGVIHIKTVEYALPPGVVLPPRQVAFTPNASLAAAPPAPSLAGLPQLANLPTPPTPGPPPPKPPAANGATTQITAFKDAKGRLRITTTAPQPEPGRIFPPMALNLEVEPLIQEAAQVHRLPPSLIRSVIKVESDFCSWAVSPKGAMGLMQLMPGTADSLGVREPFNPRENILGGCRYLRWLIDLFGGNLPLALAGYNAGYQRVIDCGYQIPAIKETQDFVSRVLGRYVAEEKRGARPWT